MKNRHYLFIFMCLWTLSNASAQQRWQEKPLGVQKLFPTQISAVNDRVAWVATWSGNFAVSPWRFVDTAHHFSRTIDGGQTWTSGTFPIVGTKGYTNNIMGLSADTAFLSFYNYTDGGVVYRTYDGGLNWTKTLARGRGMSWVHFWNKQEGVALSTNELGSFGLFKTSDSGDNWNRVTPSQIPPPLTSEIPWAGIYTATGGNTLLFSTSQRRVFRSTDKGENWTATPMPSPTQELNSITCDGKGNCLISGGNYADSLQFTGRFYRSQDTGLTWTALPINQYCGTEIRYIPNTSIALASVRKNNRLNGGGFKTLLTSDHGQTWQVIDTTTRIFAFGMVNRTTGFATEYQNDTTDAMAYRYIGSPLSGLWNAEILRGAFDVFPNPVATGNLTLSLDGFETGDYLLLVNSINGALIHRQSIHFDTKQQIILPVTDWQSGIYTLILTSAKGSVTRKVVKTD
jgi:photosystem II stability/assembly factor-like uncharacterized protein